MRTVPDPRPSSWPTCVHVHAAVRAHHACRQIGMLTLPTNWPDNPGVGWEAYKAFMQDRGLHAGEMSRLACAHIPRAVQQSPRRLLLLDMLHAPQSSARLPACLPLAD